VSLANRRSFRFGEFELKVNLRVLERDGAPVPLGSRAFDLLTYLLLHAGEVVDRDDLMKAVWPNSFVDEKNLAQQILSLRKALGTSSSCIVTVPGRGYQFAAQVTEDPAPSIPFSAGLVSDGIAQAIHRHTHVVVEESARLVSIEAAPLPAPSQPPARGRLVWTIVAATALLAGVGGWWSWKKLYSEVPGDHHEIVLATLENDTGDAAFDGTLDAALAIDLKESPYLLIAGDGKTHDTLRLMERSPDEPIAGPVAREVCQRMNDQAVLSGKIARFGQKYLVTLTASDCATGDELVRTRATASGRDTVLEAVDAAAAGMRRRLGEPLKTLKKFDTPLNAKMTRSLEALQLYSRGEALANQAKFKDAIPLFNRAIELDPSFAAAYAHLAFVYGRIGEYDLSTANYLKAWDVRDHASEYDRIYIEVQHAVKTSDGYAILRNNEDWASTYPNDIRPWINVSNGQMAMGRPDLAVEPARRAVALDPQNATAWELLCLAQMRNGQIEGAKTTYRRAVEMKLDGAPIRGVRMNIAFLERDWPEIDRQLAWAKGTKAEPDLKLVVAKMDNALGKAHAEEETMQEVVDGYRKQGLGEFADRMLWTLPRDLAEVGLTDDARRVLKTISTTVYATDYIVALAETGDIAHADAYIDIDTKGSALDTIWTEVRAPQCRAAVDLARHKPEDAIADLRRGVPFDLRGSDLMAMRGIAYLETKQPVPAAEQFQKIIDHEYIDPLSSNIALAHLGLARADAMQGKIDDARHEYGAFLSIWKDADPDLPPLKAARAELAKLGS
jgi:DNA-binding winged helix-turn-helix (wHTH) protein/Tfp pilus assembly protein PilF